MLTGQTPLPRRKLRRLGAPASNNRTAQPPSACAPDLASWQGLDALTLLLLAKDLKTAQRRCRTGRPAGRGAVIFLSMSTEKPKSEGRTDSLRSEQVCRNKSQELSIGWGIWEWIVGWRIHSGACLLFCSAAASITARKSKLCNTNASRGPDTTKYCRYRTRDIADRLQSLR